MGSLINNVVWFRRIGILCLLLLGLGLPLARTEHFWLLLFVLPVVCLSMPRKSRIAWGTALVLCVLGALIRMLVGPGDIHIAANVFSPGNDHFQDVIPQTVLDAASSDFRTRYGSYELQVPRPVARNFGQWRLPEDTTYRRRILAIDSLIDWPLGAVNDRARNYNTHKYNDTGRFGTVPPTEVMHRQHMPYYAIVTFAARHAGQRLCFRGNLFLEREGYRRLGSSQQCECIVLPTRLSGQPPTIVAYQIGPDDELHLHLEATPHDYLGEIAYRVLPWLFSTIAFVVLVDLGSLTNRRRVVLAAMLVVATSQVISVRTSVLDLPPVGAFVVHHEGWDGLTHAGLGRQIANAVRDGHYAEAFRGEEDIYYYQPGFRYVQALNLALFGPSSAGAVLAGCLVTVALLGLTRRFLPNGRDWPFLLLWLLPVLPVFDEIVFGLGLSTPVRTAATASGVLLLSVVGNGEPTALFLLLVGSAICLHLMDGRAQEIHLHLLAGLLMSFGILIRANWLPCGVIVLAGVAWTSIRHSHWRQVVTLVCSVSPLLVMPLHNYWFGNEWILTVDILQRHSQWVVDRELAQTAMAGNIGAIGHVLNHWGMLLTDGRIILIVASVVAIVMPSMPFWVRVFATAALAGFIPYLLLLYEDRHVILPDLLAALVFWRLVFFEGRRSITAAWAYVKLPRTSGRARRPLA